MNNKNLSSWSEFASLGGKERSRKLSAARRKEISDMGVKAAAKKRRKDLKNKQ
jgi:hypothetical protein